MIQGFSSGLLNRELIYQTDLPSFQRDFASLKTLDHGTGPAITFTRASGATYFDANGVLQTATNDTPRFDHDPADGGKSLGLLIEESRTNLFQRSAEFDDAYWSKTRTSITANAEIAPDGTQTADKLVEDGSNDTHLVARNITVVTGNNYALTVFAKKGERTFFRMQSFNELGDAESAIFNLDIGTIASGTSGSTITAVGNGWFRCYVPVQNNSDTISAVSFQLYSDATTSTYAGDGASGIYLWGAQIEEGAFPTSYIPTTTAAATRAAESAVVTPISSFYNQAEGTLFAEVWENATDTLYGIVSANDNSGSNRVDLRRPSGSFMRMLITNASVEQASLTPSLAQASQVLKMAGAFKANDAAVSLNGATALTDSSVTLPSVTHLRIGGLDATPATTATNGHIRKLAYWPKRLTNTLLEQLTT